VWSSGANESRTARQAVVEIQTLHLLHAVQLILREGPQLGGTASFCICIDKRKDRPLGIVRSNYDASKRKCFDLPRSHIRVLSLESSVT
jgi:hypothetical protein